MLRRSVSFAALLFLVLAAASAPAGLAITKEFNQTYPLQPGGSFELQKVNGTLRVSGIERVEDLRTVNGNIEVFEGGGSVHARTTNGNVHLELLHVQDKDGAIAETTNGSVLLAVPADTQADLETKCLNGNFSSELPVAFES